MWPFHYGDEPRKKGIGSKRLPQLLRVNATILSGRELWLVGFGLNNLTTQSIQKEMRKNRHQSKGSVNAISQPLGIHALTFSLNCIQCSFYALWLTNYHLMYDIWQTRAVHVSCVLCALWGQEVVEMRGNQSKGDYCLLFGTIKEDSDRYWH